MNWNQALFPSLKRRGGCAIKKMSRSNHSSRRRGGQIGEIFRPEEFRQTDHPVSRFFIDAAATLLFKEGNVSVLKQSVNSFTRSEPWVKIWEPSLRPGVVRDVAGIS